MIRLLIFYFIFQFQTSLCQEISVGVKIPKKNPLEKAIIYFNDSTSLEGFGRLKTIFSSKEEVIIFKVEESDKDEVWTYKDVIGITIISEDDIIHYEYLKIKKYSFPELYEVVTEGTIKLYKIKKDNSIEVNMYPQANNSSNINKGNLKIEKEIYYLKKETEEYPTKIKDNYIKALAEYMKDCDFLVEDIKNHKYNYSQIKDLVEEYNANCGE